MPIGTSFHSRTSALSVSQNWRVWSGYLAASSYDVVHDYEYHSIRNTAGMIDVSPLYKYDVRGKDAAKLVDRVITRDAHKCAVGQALYACLCENDGAVIQDGTVFRIAEDYFRFHLAEPALRWLKLNASGLAVSIEEVSGQIAALALQGPNAFKILAGLVDFELGRIRFFRFASGRLEKVPVIVSRTGYTGDLGYEIWAGAEHAEHLWDVLIDYGSSFGIKPAGLLALDVARLEAGFILLEVDYTSSEKALIQSQRYSPFEIGLGWTVDPGKANFVGARSLKKLRENGPARQIVGLEIDLTDYEYLFTRIGLPPQFPTAAWRGSAALFKDDRQMGHATTGGWSPVLKKYIVLATVEKEYSTPETRLEMEVTVNHKRRTTAAKVVRLPFFDPPRKRALFGREAKDR